MGHLDPGAGRGRGRLEAAAGLRRPRPRVDHPAPAGRRQFRPVRPLVRRLALRPLATPHDRPAIGLRSRRGLSRRRDPHRLAGLPGEPVRHLPPQLSRRLAGARDLDERQPPLRLGAGGRDRLLRHGDRGVGHLRSGPLRRQDAPHLARRPGRARRGGRDRAAGSAAGSGRRRPRPGVGQLRGGARELGQGAKPARPARHGPRLPDLRSARGRGGRSTRDRAGPAGPRRWRSTGAPRSTLRNRASSTVADGSPSTTKAACTC